jgi:hypothetical protein
MGAGNTEIDYLFKILKLMRGVMILFWDGICGKTFLRLKKLEEVMRAKRKVQRIEKWDHEKNQ